MARIDNLIDEEINRQTYVTECLILLRNIYNTGDCNICAKQNECEYAPKPGQIVRYNCPFFEKEKEKPSVYSQEKPGHWTKVVEHGQHKIKCPKCGYIEPEYATYIRNYCPNCGKRMEDEE